MSTVFEASYTELKQAKAQIARLRAERDDLHATNERLVALMCAIADYYEHHFVEGETAYQAVILIRAALAADGGD